MARETGNATHRADRSAGKCGTCGARSKAKRAGGPQTITHRPDCTDSRDRIADTIAADYRSAFALMPAPCRVADCKAQSVVRSRSITDDRWCLEHFIGVVVARAEHEQARADAPDVIGRLEAALHRLYHDLDDSRRRVEAIAGGLPECGNLVLPGGE